MEFSSFAFLSFFLPAVLLLHTVLPGKRSMALKNALLIIASILFYTYGEQLYVILLLVSVAVNYFLGLMLGRKKSKRVVGMAVVLNISLLFVFKYLGFAATALNMALPASLHVPVPEIRLPIGISFYTFQALSYVIDVYRGEAESQRSFPRLLLYISFFPQLIAGPIIKYRDVADQITDRRVTAEGIKRGSFRFICGLGKKVLISDVMALAADTVFSLAPGEVGVLAAWVGSISYLFQIYFDFSGYSDMAIGLGRMFGFEFAENFRYPYTAVSIQDFWHRWHISLSTWFREYLYIPLGGNRRGKVRTLLNRCIVFLATGIWHGANWTFLFWGAYHGALLVAESTGVIPAYSKQRQEKGVWAAVGSNRILSVLWKTLSRIYTIFAVLIGFVLFRADTIGQAGEFLAAMFGFGADGGVGYAAAVPFLSPYHIFILAVAIIGSTPLPHMLWTRFFGAANITTEDGSTAKIRLEPIMMAASVAVLVLCYMSLASGSYSPFIYFRF